MDKVKDVCVKSLELYLKCDVDPEILNMFNLEKYKDAEFILPHEHYRSGLRMLSATGCTSGEQFMYDIMPLIHIVEASFEKANYPVKVQANNNIGSINEAFEAINHIPKELKPSSYQAPGIDQLIKQKKEREKEKELPKKLRTKLGWRKNK